MSYIELGPTLRRLRKQRGLKQGDVALQLGCDIKSLCNWERGYHDPRWSIICALAKFYKLDADELVSKAKRFPRS